MVKANEDKNYKRRFEKGFHLLTSRRSSYEVWYDLIHLFAIGISNTATRNVAQLQHVWDEREEQYKRIANKYSSKERKLFPQMFALVVMELDSNQDQDFLGEMYMRLEISNKNAGQFFTPYSVCKAMSEITIDKKSMSRSVKENGYASIYDCACGAGATLIAAVNQCKKLFNRLNYQNHIYIVGQDIDETAAMMCYIQLSLLGVAAVVKVGCTLSDPSLCITKDNAKNFYFSPMWFSSVWSMRRIFHGMDLAMNKINGGNNG